MLVKVKKIAIVTLILIIALTVLASCGTGINIGTLDWTLYTNTEWRSEDADANLYFKDKGKKGIVFDLYISQVCVTENAETVGKLKSSAEGFTDTAVGKYEDTSIKANITFSANGDSVTVTITEASGFSGNLGTYRFVKTREAVGGEEDGTITVGVYDEIYGRFCRVTIGMTKVEVEKAFGEKMESATTTAYRSSYNEEYAMVYVGEPFPQYEFIYEAPYEVYLYFAFIEDVLIEKLQQGLTRNEDATDSCVITEEIYESIPFDITYDEAVAMTKSAGIYYAEMYLHDGTILKGYFWYIDGSEARFQFSNGILVIKLFDDVMEYSPGYLEAWGMQ